jgi:hypothetical protein
VARPTPNGPMSARRPWSLSLAAPIGSLKPEVIDLPSPSIDAIRSVRAFWPPSAIRSTDGYDGGRRKRTPPAQPRDHRTRGQRSRVLPRRAGQGNGPAGHAPIATGI